MEMQFRTVARDNSRRLLPAMLQSVEAKISEVRRFGMAEDAEYTTLIMKMIVSEGGSALLLHLGRPRMLVGTMELISNRRRKKPPQNEQPTGEPKQSCDLRNGQKAHRSQTDAYCSKEESKIAQFGVKAIYPVSGK
jgi:hypothetical protein